MISINLLVAIGRKIIRGKQCKCVDCSFPKSSNTENILLIYRPDSLNSFDWFTEKQTKILRFIRTFLQSNGTDREPRAVKQAKIMYQGCMDTGNDYKMR